MKGKIVDHREQRIRKKALHDEHKGQKKGSSGA